MPAPPSPTSSAKSPAGALTSNFRIDQPGLTQLANLERLPLTGALLVVSPLRLVGGTGSPSRVYAFVAPDPQSRSGTPKRDSRPSS
jgi:hypothetical protein